MAAQQPPGETAPMDELSVPCCWGQGVTVTSGIAMFGLSPGVPRPVAPSGTPELELDWIVDAMSSSLWAGVVDADALPEFVELHPAPPEIPPPSNDPFELLPGQGIVSGLIPVGVSSVAPSGMLATELPGDCSEGVAPSGEVVPMPAVDAVCAWTAAPTIQIIASMQDLRIDVSRIVKQWSPSRPVPSADGADCGVARRPLRTSGRRAGSAAVIGASDRLRCDCAIDPDSNRAISPAIAGFSSNPDARA